jgi:indolepyruvate ferredoxin oxidoreductase beta subunit
MAQAAEDAGSVISAVLFGALAGTKALPFERAQFEATIERGGVGVKPSLKAFARGYDEAQGRRGVEALADVSPRAGDRLPAGSEVAGSGTAATSGVAAPAASALDGTTDAPPAAGRTAGPSQGISIPPSAPSPPAAPLDPRLRSLLERIDRDFPAAARPMLREGVRRLVDWQDLGYAQRYLDRLAPVCTAARDDGTLLSETARHLALWMSYEDTIRVAQLKTRDTRFARVKTEVRAADDQVLAIDEYLHPRVQELAETLPGFIGRRLERQGWLRSLAERFTTKGRIVTTSSLRGYLLLSTVAAMRRWRPTTTRWAAEQSAIERWLARIAETAPRDPLLATEIARCQRLVKGYSDTHERGVRNFETVMGALDASGGRLAPAAVRELRDAALADEHGRALEAALARHAPAPSVPHAERRQEPVAART